jgi:hypothetical protein
MAKNENYFSDAMKILILQFSIFVSLMKVFLTLKICLMFLN